MLRVFSHLRHRCHPSCAFYLTLPPMPSHGFCLGSPLYATGAITSVRIHRQTHLATDATCATCAFPSREKLKDVIAEGSTANGTVRRHARENLDRAVETVQATERQLSIEVRWTTEDPEWIQAAELVVKRRYRRAIDTLEGLVVKRILELTKVNQSGLGQCFFQSGTVDLTSILSLQTQGPHCKGSQNSIQSHPERPESVQCSCRSA